MPARLSHHKLATVPWATHRQLRSTTLARTTEQPLPPGSHLMHSPKLSDLIWNETTALRSDCTNVLTAS